MYTKDLKHKMTLRMDDELYNFVCMASDVYRLSPSDFIRQCVGTAKFGFDKALKCMEENSASLINEGKDGFENGIDHKTVINDQL